MSERIELRRRIENLLGRQLAEVEPYAKDFALNPFSPKLPYLEFIMECVGVENTEFAKTILQYGKKAGLSISIPRQDSLTQLAIKTARSNGRPPPSLFDGGDGA